MVTATSTGNTEKILENKPNKHVIWQNNLIKFSKHERKNDATKRCSSSRRRRTIPFRPWVRVWGFVDKIRGKGLSVNRVLNEGFLLWFEEGDECELRLRARLARLLREENELRHSMRVILRSGAFLDSYVAKLVKGDERLGVKLGRQPLEAIANDDEVEVVKRILARREAVVEEICEIQKKLLPEDEYELKSSRSRRHDITKRNGGEKT